MLRRAVADLSWLLSRDYAVTSALQLVGNHFQLARRQRVAVMRCACSDQSLAGRAARELAMDQLAGAPLLLDGYNVLTTVEAALAGGYLLLGRDRCLRDMASMHGSFRKVAETPKAVGLIGTFLETCGVTDAHWYLDQPVSNSGRLKALILDVAAEHGWNWRVDLVRNPDRTLIDSDGHLVSADSVILDQCGAWFNLTRHIVEHDTPDAVIVDLGSGGSKYPQMTQMTQI